MNTLPPFVILTAWRWENSAIINADSMNMMGRQIEARGFLYGKITIVDSMGGESPAYVVPLLNADQVAKAYCLYQLARHYGQRNVLYADANRLASDIHLAEGRGGPDVEREVIRGQFVSISDLDATLCAQHIRDEHGFNYTIRPRSIP